MKDYHKKIDWLRVILAIVSALALSAVFLLIDEKTIPDGLVGLCQSVMSDLVALLIVIPIVYLIFTIKGISPQEELKQEIIEGISKINHFKSGFESNDDVNQRFNFREKAKSLKQLDIIALTATNVLSNARMEITSVLKNGCKIRILIVEPGSNIAQAIMTNQRGEELEPDLKRAKKRIQQILEDLDGIKHSGSIEIRGIGWTPSCSLVITNRDRTEAEIRVKVYPIVIDVPITTIKTHTIVYKRFEPELFDYFVNHFEHWWQRSKVL